MAHGFRGLLGTRHLSCCCWQQCVVRLFVTSWWTLSRENEREKNKEQIQPPRPCSQCSPSSDWALPPSSCYLAIMLSYFIVWHIKRLIHRLTVSGSTIIYSHSCVSRIFQVSFNLVELTVEMYTVAQMF